MTKLIRLLIKGICCLSPSRLKIYSRLTGKTGLYDLYERPVSLAEHLSSYGIGYVMIEVIGILRDERSRSSFNRVEGLSIDEIMERLSKKCGIVRSSTGRTYPVNKVLMLLRRENLVARTHMRWSLVSDERIDVPTIIGNWVKLKKERILKGHIPKGCFADVLIVLYDNRDVQAKGRDIGEMRATEIHDIIESGTYKKYTLSTIRSELTYLRIRGAVNNREGYWSYAHSDDNFKLVADCKTQVNWRQLHEQL